MQIPPFKLERYFARYEFSARYLLCSSDIESVTIQNLLDLEPGSAERFQQQWLGYTESAGAPALREAVSQLYTSIDPSEILVHSGAEEAIFLFMNAVLQPGDHIIVHWPCYQSLYEIAKSIGCEITFWQAREKDGWALDLEELKAHIKTNTKAIIVNTPHNPTGYLMTKPDFLKLNQLAQERNLVLFSDEVYRESEYSPDLRLPAACEINPLAVSLGVMSKTYGLPGLRIGWVATRNREVFQKMAAQKDYTSICNSAPSEFLAEVALRHRENLVQRNLQFLRQNLSLLEDFFSRNSGRFAWVKPLAGPIAFPKLLGAEVEPFCHDLVTSRGVLLLPGTLYGENGNHFRIGFGRKNMPEALAQLESFLSETG